jgi:cytochrome c-type biogenesis protein CcmE
MVLSFSVKDPKGSEIPVPVVYRGLKPDMFAAGRDVLIDGDYEGSVIKAAKLQTQCPSKYEPVVPGAPTASQASP